NMQTDRLTLYLLGHRNRVCCRKLKNLFHLKRPPELRHPVLVPEQNLAPLRKFQAWPLTIADGLPELALGEFSGVFALKREVHRATILRLLCKHEIALGPMNHKF